MHLLFDSPDVYMGLPVNIVGRIDKIIKSGDGSIQFSASVRTGGQSQI